MKTIFTLCLVAALFSCNTSKQIAGGSQMGLRNLNSYYLKNPLASNNNYQGIVVADAISFNNIFYSEPQKQEATVTPDFSGQILVALALNTADNKNVQFVKAETKGNYINVFGQVKTEEENLVYSPVAVATLPKWLDAKEIHFYVDNNLVETVKVSFKNKNNIFASEKINKPESII